VVVAEQRLQRSVAEDVVGDLARDLAPLFAGQRSAVERELLGDDAENLLRELFCARPALGAVGRVELGPELGDARVMDPRLQVGVRASSASPL
jgi:hypothetical protein